jgi:peptide/nickel transport system permease protein
MIHRAALGWLGLVLLVGLASPWVPYDPATDVHTTEALLGPGPGHWLGTDHLGRDVLFRSLIACKSFVGPGLAACLVASVLGVPTGALAGFYGGFLESAVRYAFTVLGSVPRFVLVLLVLSIYGNGTWILAGIAGIAFVPVLGEATFGRIAALREADYVIASRAHGLSDARILWVHLVWGACRRRILRELVTLFGYFVVLETTLSYIGGFGIQEPLPSWGNMLVFEWDRGGSAAFVPLALLLVSVLAVVLAGEGLAEKADV